MFDDVAEDYEAQLAKGLAASGEGQEFFARARIDWLRDRLEELSFTPGVVLDYGCGTGSTTPLLLGALAAERVIGADVSEKSLEVARRAYAASPAISFRPVAEPPPPGSIDLAYCNGVFHHIPPAERNGALGSVRQSLRDGGLFSFWENNPWNPGTRYVMSRIPFDRDAITIAPPEARRLLRRAGFSVLRTDFLFFFPRALAWFRRFEPSLSSIPLGGQYHLLCRREQAR